MDKANAIITRFYANHEKITGIAKVLNVNPSYVTKIIKKDSRYIMEKELRNKISKENRRIYQNNWTVLKRRENQELDDIVRNQHFQASIELSVPNFI